MQSFIQSKWLLAVLSALAALLVVCGVFRLGMVVGERRVTHMARFVQNYPHMFNRPMDFRGRPPMAPSTDPMFGSHGVFGKVISVSGQTVVVQGKDNEEENVLVTSSTKIRIGNEDVSFSEIHPGENAAVFGAPNDAGQIEARLIRMMGTR